MHKQKTIKFSVNRHGYNKQWDFETLATGYEDSSGTLQDVADHIRQGHAVCAGLLGGQRRTKANVTGSEWILLDVDNTALDAAGNKVYDPQLTLEQAIAHPFIQQYCALIYTSASHRPDWHKFRLVFLLPQFESDTGIIEAMIRQLMEQLPHDPACKDASRVFYGNTAAEIPLFNPDVTLPAEWRAIAIATATEEAAKKEKQRRDREVRAAEYKRQIESGELKQQDTDALVLDALQAIPPRDPGSGNYQECLTVLMALYDHYGESEAERVAEQWSPSIKGTSWDVGRKLRSFKHGGVTIGSLFHIAKQHGWKFPERTRLEPKSSHRFSDLLGGIIPRLKQRFEKLRRSPWGFGRKGAVEVAVTNVTPQVFEYEQGDRLQTWQKSVEAGYKHVLDSSGTGSGKSFDAGLVTGAMFGAQQAVYASADHRNPTTTTLQEWHDLEARHKGLYRDDFNKLRRVDNHQSYVISPNCGRNETISALRAKNIPGADMSELICRTCPNFEPCRAGATFGYLQERAIGLKQPRFRAHPASLPSPEIDFDPSSGDDPPFDYGNTVLIWEEAGETIKAHRSIVVSTGDVQRAIADLVAKQPEKFDSLRPTLTPLLQHLNGDIKQPNKYGWGNTQVREALPSDLDIDIDAVREALNPDPERFLNTTTDHGVDAQDLPRNVRKKFTDRDKSTAEKITAELALNWLPDFLNVLLGKVVGSLRINYGKLTITLGDDRLAEIVQAAKTNIYLDATATASDLARTLGIDVEQIAVVRQRVEPANNLKITQVTTLGRLGLSQRSEHCQKRVDALVAQIKADNPGNTAVIDFKRHTKQGDEKRHWWKDSRGINDLENCSTLIFTGTPCPNLGDLQAEFTVKYGRSPTEGKEAIKYAVQVIGQPLPDVQPYFEMDVSVDPEFRVFVRNRILADINQGIGRLRADRRPGEQLKVYILADYPVDFPVRLVKASDITPEAATKPERVAIKIRRAVQQFKAAGQKVTQSEIAQAVGVSQSYISQMFGELLQTLLDPLYSKSNNSKQPLPDPDDQQWISSEYLPLLAESPPDELLAGVLDTFKAYGKSSFKLIWEAVPAKAQISILQTLIATLPASERELESLLEVCF